MAPDPNIFRPDFDQERDHEGFRARRAFLARQLGARRIGLSLWEVAPGQAAYPYHFHLNEEEVLVVLEGEPSLRTPDGWRVLERGAVVAFPTGESGAHQFVNRTADPVRLLAISTAGAPDIVLYPDSGKLGAGERRHGGGGVQAYFRMESAVDYYDGESPPTGPTG